MPKHQSLTINLVDLDNVIQLITDKKPAGGVVEIIDTGFGFVVRDKDGMSVGSIIKVTSEETATQP